jgi:hypothetical protein
MSTWRHRFEHGQDLNLLFGRDSFVNMVPVRIWSARTANMDGDRYGK